jgi:hypothetical protein
VQNSVSKEIQIPYSNTKFCLVMAGCLSFVVLGIMILLDAQAMTSLRYGSEFLNRVIAICCMLFFGAIFITIPLIFFKNKMGLIIDEQGITDNSSFSSVGLIEWKDIKGIRTVKFQRTKALLIDTNKPKKYINKAESSFKKRLLNSNKRIYGTPLYITSLILNIGFNDLEKIMIEAFNERNTKHQHGT